MSERGQGWIIVVIIILFLAAIFAIVGTVSGISRCATNIWEIMQFWKDFCSMSIVY